MTQNYHSLIKLEGYKRENKVQKCMRNNEYTAWFLIKAFTTYVIFQ